MTPMVARRTGVAVALVAFGWASLPAQQRPGGDRPPFPSAPWERGVVAEGLPVSPFFEGWYENPDGSHTLSFGFFNRNREETLHIPHGPDNFLAPGEYDGAQPTIFAPGRGTGVFTVTVPGGFDQDGGRVVWTLRTGDQPAHSVPGKVGVEAYRLHHIPMGMGSLPPLLKLDPEGPELWGQMTLAGDARETATWSTGTNPVGSQTNPVVLTASVGTPLALTVWVADRQAPGSERDPVGGGATWFTHAGPAAASLSEERIQPDAAAGGLATTTVTFDQPGEYVLRVRADNFNPVDSTPQDQCCWTNGFVRVGVEP
ncbi:MAG: hypothetical protein QGI10_00030 [Vicinamibacterales bacterium]|nr:hypothetical protein [Vicinamibacterales bacterium]HJN46077.1 hypothetical protein [Vicinamibacterales bacterium]